jgi:hypothetical protein
MWNIYKINQDRPRKWTKYEVRLSGSYAALSGALRISTKPGQLPNTAQFFPVWLHSADSEENLMNRAFSG